MLALIRKREKISKGPAYYGDNSERIVPLKLFLCLLICFFSSKIIYKIDLSVFNKVRKVGYISAADEQESETYA